MMGFAASGGSEGGWESWSCLTRLSVGSVEDDGPQGCVYLMAAAKYIRVSA